MEQTMVMGVNYGVAEGQFSDGKGEMETRRVLIFIDPDSDKQYHFPLTLDQADDIAEKLTEGGDSPLVVPPKPPTEEELEEMARIEAATRKGEGRIVGGKG